MCKGWQEQRSGYCIVSRKCRAGTKEARRKNKKKDFEFWIFSKNLDIEAENCCSRGSDEFKIPEAFWDLAEKE